MYKAIDLFCGAGGFSKGVELTNKFKIEKAFDYDEKVLKTYNYNHDSEGIKYDISKSPPKDIISNKIDIVFGSPPCQGFSDARGSRDVNDERNNLVFNFINWVKEINPQIAVMENVSGMLTIDKKYLKSVVSRYKDAGYVVDYSILNSKDFGVPQRRERAFFIATKNGNPPPHMVNNCPQMDLFSSNIDFKIGKTTVGEAISDLPKPTKDGVAKYKYQQPENEYQKLMRQGQNEIYNHISQKPKKYEIDILKRIPEGKMYRSTRFGEKYIGVWDLFRDKFNTKERLIFWFIARFRGRKEFKAERNKSGPSYIPEEKIINGLNKRRVKKEASQYNFPNLMNKKIKADKNDVRKLESEGWLRAKEIRGVLSYDLNTKSGIRPRYMRLNRGDQSNTIMTSDFKVREKVHPTQNRGLSLREGARIQSFTDDFIFRGDFKDIATQIGNAVPPLMAKSIGEHIYKLLENSSNKQGASM